MKFLSVNYCTKHTHYTVNTNILTRNVFSFGLFRLLPLLMQHVLAVEANRMLSVPYSNGRNRNRVKGE